MKSIVALVLCLSLVALCHGVPGGKVTLVKIISAAPGEPLQIHARAIGGYHGYEGFPPHDYFGHHLGFNGGYHGYGSHYPHGHHGAHYPRGYGSQYLPGHGGHYPFGYGGIQGHAHVHASASSRSFGHGFGFGK